MELHRGSQDHGSLCEEELKGVTACLFKENMTTKAILSEFTAPMRSASYTRTRNGWSIPYGRRIVLKRTGFSYAPGADIPWSDLNHGNNGRSAL